MTDTTHSLQQLMLAIASGDEAAFSLYYDATISYAYGMALRIMRNPNDAEEVVSDTYLQIWRTAASFDPEKSRPKTWLLTICRSRAIDLLRKKRKTFNHVSIEEERLPENLDEDPQHLLSVIERDHRLKNALNCLEPIQRQMIALAFFRGFSHQEIANHTNTPLGSVKTHIRKSLIVLRQYLTHEQMPNGELT